MDKITLSKHTIFWMIGVISAILIFVGAFLPWIKITAPFIGSMTASGIEGDGLITLILSLLAFLMIYIGLTKSEKIAAIVLLVFGMICIVIGVYDATNIFQAIYTLEYALSSVGSGVYLTIIGGVGLIISGIGNIYHTMQILD